MFSDVNEIEIKDVWELTLRDDTSRHQSQSRKQGGSSRGRNQGHHQVSKNCVGSCQDPGGKGRGSEPGCLGRNSHQPA